MLYRKGLSYQRGQGGFAGIFRSLYKVGKPIINGLLHLGRSLLGIPEVKDTVKDVAKSGLNIGVKTLGNVLKGEDNFKNSLIKNATQEKQKLRKNVVKRIENVITGKRKKQNKGNMKNKKKKKKKSFDLFNDN